MSPSEEWGNAGTCLGHGKMNRSHMGPGGCFCHGPATCWGPVLWGDRGVPVREQQVLGAWGVEGGGQSWALAAGRGEAQPPPRRKPDLPSLGTQRQPSGTWH